MTTDNEEFESLDVAFGKGQVIPRGGGAASGFPDDFNDFDDFGGAGNSTFGASLSGWSPRCLTRSASTAHF